MSKYDKVASKHFKAQFRVLMEHVKIGDATARIIPDRGIHAGYDRLGKFYSLFVFDDGELVFKATRYPNGKITLRTKYHPPKICTVHDWPEIKELYHEYRTKRYSKAL